ncbi:hypothetical protein MUK42_25751 [Musa troglodytarum]|uniref:Uncharacterized protein n=1 Tax=Musa troglodytarum TaxID=320322 RepID=A0A9E7FJR8_9LILI|nr:hypothetical protein MUK42_25751 [Musa troglodytarum]
MKGLLEIGMEDGRLLLLKLGVALKMMNLQLAVDLSMLHLLVVEETSKMGSSFYKIRKKL